MTNDQFLLFSVLAATLVLFVWNRWRYDVVALTALLVVALANLVPPEQVFAGFGHPAVVTVIAVLVLSKGLINAGVVEFIGRLVTRVGQGPTVQVATLTAMVALCSSLMNNVGALALLMPVAIWMSRKSSVSPSLFLMPLAFGSLLGGTITLVGTPPNIIIASYRVETDGPPFGMFDFAPVGIGITVVGVLFITLIGWRITPQRKEVSSADELFEIGEYISEVRVPEKSKANGRSLHELLTKIVKNADINVLKLVRGDQRVLAPAPYRVLQENDILLVEADSESLQSLLNDGNLELAESKEDTEGKLESDDVKVIEAIVTAESFLVDRTATSLDLRERLGINVLAVARQGQRLRQRLGKVRFLVGDILLLQGSQDSLKSALADLGCLPLAERGLRLGKPRKLIEAVLVFAAALALIAAGFVPVQIALVCAAVVMIVMGLLSTTEAYKSIDWPVVVLLAAMMPLGEALETTGGAQLIANQLLQLARNVSPTSTIAILLVGTMLLSNVVNNAAAAILMAPIAIAVSRGLQVSADPLLMAVAVGASCAFLTPVGHQSNALVMAPGGYKFGDYCRLGLPLSLLITATAVPLIAWFWPM